MTAPLVLVLSGVDPCGRAGLARDVATLADERVDAAAVPTCTTVQVRGAVDQVTAAPPDRFRREVEAALEDRRPDAVKIGLLPTAALAATVVELAPGFDAPVVLDPVLHTGAGAPLTLEPTDAALRALVRTVDLVTPNLPEARRLAERFGPGGPVDLAGAVQGNGGPAVLVKGGHAEGPVVRDLLLTTRPIWFESPRLDLRATPGLGRGKGCELASRIAAKLAKGLQLADAVSHARRQLQDRLEAEARLHARGPEEAPRLVRYTRALEELLAELRPDCVPEVGSNLAWSPAAAREASDVIGLAGRITIAGAGSAVAGRPAPGGPHHTGRIALALHLRRGGDWWVLNHRHWAADWDRVASRPDALLLDRTREPADATSTMEWMVEEMLRTRTEPATFLADRGAVGKEAMVRILARDESSLLLAHRRLHGLPSTALPEGAVRPGVPAPR